MKKKVALGIAGSVVLFVAQFSSTVRVPVMGGAEGYIYNGAESIVIVLALAILSFVFTVRKKFKALRIVGIIALITPVLFYVYAITVLSKVRSSIEHNFIKESSVPAELAEIMVNHPAEIMFGEVLLVLGAILILMASLIKSSKTSDL